MNSLKIAPLLCLVAKIPMQMRVLLDNAAFTSGKSHS